MVFTSSVNALGWLPSKPNLAGSPTLDEREAYAFGYREDAIASLRGEAEGIMAAFAEQAVQEQAQELRADALSAETRAVLSGIDSRLTTLGGYWHHIVGHLVGFVALVGIAAIFAMLIAFEPSLERIFHWIVEKVRS